MTSPTDHDEAVSGGWTAGPWKFIGDRVISKITYDTICATHLPPDSFGTIEDASINDANARLIASAPALVEALRGLLKTVEAQQAHGLRWDPETVDAARQALTDAGVAL